MTTTTPPTTTPNHHNNTPTPTPPPVDSIRLSDGTLIRINRTPGTASSATAPSRRQVKNKNGKIKWVPRGSGGSKNVIRSIYQATETFERNCRVVANETGWKKDQFGNILRDEKNEPIPFVPDTTTRRYTPGR